MSNIMKLIATTFIGTIFGFFLGVLFPTFSLTQINLSTSLFPSSHLTYVEDKYSGLSTQALLNAWSTLKGGRGVPPQAITFGYQQIHEELKDYHQELLYLRPISTFEEHGDFTRTPRYLVTFTVGYDQKANIDKCVKKFSENFTIVLFHYDGRTSEWDEFEWSKRAIHVSARKQTKWWYAKRFLHPDIVSVYDYIFIWDEDLGVDHFNAEKYLELVKKHGLEISQPGLRPDEGLTWQMTKRRADSGEVHKVTEERPGWCPNPVLPPCAAFIEIMAPVFSRNAWRCVWHMIQNDLVHGWGLDFALRKCVEPAHEKIGVIDSQWIVHQTIPSLANQVRERCRREWEMFQDRMANAEQAYFESLGFIINNTERYPTLM
ncbi:hypothetical protein Cgig2_009243 [Carnegiea gigantea]|uniref:Uncharacterized protein n=1 Tax=Carnegiea gigantea TaxID=171969 RepID=A0A9Q1JHZ3_9CARY|nr:hypothetical protein Cgig2_009243 [Carnegiea gigantea]